MTWPMRVAILVSLALWATSALADLNAIHKNQLPEDKPVQKALVNVRKVESLVRDWSPTWPYRIPKGKVASLLSSSLAALQEELKKNPKNEELALLTGLVAHYAYNVDVKGTYRIAVDALEQAHGLSPGDYRPQWFLGIHRCEAGEVVQGMDALLLIESQMPWRKLPLGFWDDYVECATLANMPAHALRAADHLKQLHAAPSEGIDFLVKTNQRRFEPTNASATYSMKETWTAVAAKSEDRFINALFGFSFSVPAAWRLALSPAQKGSCDVRILTPPDSGKAGNASSTIFVIAKIAKQGESLPVLLARAIPTGAHAVPIKPHNCPGRKCESDEWTDSGYKSEGGGVAILTAFARPSPQFPGLLFEHPTAPPSVGGTQVKYEVPEASLRRLDGTIYYLILLDTGRSTLTKAESDYRWFLKNMQVE